MSLGRFIRSGNPTIGQLLLLFASGLFCATISSNAACSLSNQRRGDVTVNTQNTGESINTLQAIVDAAATGSTVTLPPGRYHGTLLISQPLHVKGAPGGATTIDGAGKQPGLTVFHKQGQVQIEGLIITGGSDSNGAGIQIHNGGKVLLKQVTITANSAEYRGGAITISEGLLTLIDCTISDNKAQLGGGIYAGGLAQVKILTSRIEGNQAEEGGGCFFHGQGGGTIVRTIFNGNQASKSGGHVFLLGTSDHARPSLTLEGCSFEALAAESNGKAIENHGKYQATLVLNNTVLPD